MCTQYSVKADCLKAITAHFEEEAAVGQALNEWVVTDSSKLNFVTQNLSER